MNQIITMKEMPEQDRPYEKCLQYGPAVLSDAELLAVILRTGCQGRSSLQLAGDILRLTKVADGLAGIFHLSVEQLCELNGVGKVKAVQVLCIGELSKRIARTPVRSSVTFRDPETIAEYYMETLRHEEQEHVICLMLDTKSRFIGDVELTKGTVNLALISPREIFVAALQRHAVFIILIHNHPSGDPMPSQEDKNVTMRVEEAGRLIGVSLLDHIVIGDRRYFSFAQAGLIRRKS